MSKIKITEAACFEEVAKVIGAKNAERELFIASQSKNSLFEDCSNLYIAFYWSTTKQGHTFWSLINKGVNPYE